ncbi:MAG: hypothetical protein WB676_30750 [Bryobacteraceae bacterium]
MYLFHIFRSFLPLHNPIGFGAADLVELALAACLLFVVLANPPAKRLAALLMGRPAICMTALAALPVILRLVLLPQSPAPMPAGADDFSYVLLADTLTHLRLANPTHPMYRFFETNFVLQQPTYSSIFPLGQGLVLALGHALFRNFWAGVVLSVALLCSLSYWMLRGWTTEGWALVGGLLAVIQFGPLSRWMNTYWGGAVSAIAGCLVFGALPRLRASWRNRDAAVLGVGMGIQLLTRPFEFTLLVLSVILFFIPAIRDRVIWKLVGTRAATALATMLPAIVLMLLQNKSVTGSWTTVPYMVGRYEYGVPVTFTFQRNPRPHRTLTAEQELDYKAQAGIHGERTDTLTTYLQRLAYRIRYYRFFFLPPLFFVLPFFFASERRLAVVYITSTVVLFALGTNFYPYFYSHYIAALTSLFLLASVMGLERLSKITIAGFRTGHDVSRLIVLLCLTHFLFWYTLHLIDSDDISDVFDYETSSYINSDDPEGRIDIDSQLAKAPGRQLVFVRYGPKHEFEEWIHNAANIDSARVVWACDRGATEDQQLIRYFHDRNVWLVEPDLDPPKLTRYQPQAPVFEDVH